MKRMKYYWLIVMMIFISCNGEKEKQPVLKNQDEIKIADVLLSDLSGKPIDMAQYKDKTVFINFWATWCGPCLKEMPSIQKAMEKLKAEKIVFLFASDETSEQIQEFKNEHQYDFNYVQSLNTQALNIMALPTTFIFNADGVLVFNEPGFRNWDSKENIDLLLNIIK